MSLQEQAFNLAQKYHEHQRDWGGYPYMDHLRAVALPFIHDPIMFSAAILHDILEDTDATPEILFDHGMPSEVIAIVETLTHDKENDSYEFYIEKVIQSPQARKIKMSDLRHNFGRPHGKPNLHRRYIYAMTRIGEIEAAIDWLFNKE